MDLDEVAQIARNVFWVGIKDRDRRLFDSLIPLPVGATYNAYLIVGKEKRALIDTTNPGFEDGFENRIRQIMEPADLIM